MDLHSKMTMYITSTMTSPVTKTAKTSKWLRLKSQLRTCVFTTLSKVLYLVLTCSNLKVFSSSRMCTKLKQILELNSLYYYSVLTCSNTFY